MYACVFANLHTFRGLVTDSSLKRRADAREPGHAFLCNFGIRLFDPIAWASFTCPLTEKVWHLSSEALDFRAAQNETAMIPRDGPWYSNWECTLSGPMRLTSPLEGNTLGLPTEIAVSMRVSWTPAHCVIRFQNKEILQKISFRPWQGFASFWKKGTFDANVFTREHKLAAPLMFFIPGEIPSEAAYTPFAESEPPAPEPVPPRPDDDDWATWKAESWHEWTQNDWPAYDQSDDTKSEQSARKSVDDFDKKEVQKSEPLAPEPKSDSSDDVTQISLGPVPNTPPPLPTAEFNESSRQGTELVPEIMVTQPPEEPIIETIDDVAGTWSNLSAAPESSIVTEEPPIHVDDVPVPVSDKPPTPRVSVAMSASVTSSEFSPTRYREDFQSLQLMANNGPPRTLDERYARQVLANRLDLTPLMYNMMVFGEVPTVPAQDKYI